MYLIYALSNRQARAVRRLVRHFGSHKRLLLTLVKHPRSSLLLYYFVIKQTWLVRLLVVRGCNINRWYKCLLDAHCLNVAGNNIRSLCFLIFAGANINAQNHIGDSIIKRGFYNERVTKYCIFLRSGVDLDCEDLRHPTIQDMLCTIKYSFHYICNL